MKSLHKIILFALLPLMGACSGMLDIERYRNDPVRLFAVQHSAASAGGEVSAPHQMDN